MNHVDSADGTSIALERTGSGPALVLVVGAFCDRHSKKNLTAALSDSFTVYEYDRRGRGDSGPLTDGSVEREVDDLAAVVSVTGELPFVFGDSSGGAIAIEAAAAGVRMAKVAVYEVPFTPGPTSQAPTRAFADELAQLAESGQLGEAAARFLKLMGTPEPVLAGMKQGPYWSHMEAFASTLPVDIRLCNNGEVPTERLGKVTVPLLALAGSAGPWAGAVATAVAAAVPQGEAQILNGYGHDVPDDVLAPELRSFFC